MAASTISQPASPASAYRPLQFVFDRSDQSGAQVIEIRVADAADVTALGAGLAVGDILVEHAAPLDGTPVPIAVGQTVTIRDCGKYSGVRKVTKVIDQDGTPSDFLVIQAPDYGTVTPASGGIRVWLDRYAIVCELSVYTNPATDPQVVLMRGTADNDGGVTIDVGKDIRDYFSERIDTFALAVPGGTIVQNAHGVTALFYRVRIAETYALPGEDYPTTSEDIFAEVPGANILIDDFNDEGAPYWRVAVNAVHPYRRTNEAGTEILTWEDADMEDFEATGSAQKALTYAPRTLTMADSDRFRLHFLNPIGDAPDEYKVDRGLKIREVADDGTETTITTLAFDLGSARTSAFSVAVGPADLSPFITVPARYSVQVVGGDLLHLDSEKFIINVDAKCKEVRRPTCVLNLLGGVDHYSFTGREIATTKGGATNYTLSSAPVDKDVRRWLVENFTARGKVATLQKPYSAGTGYDWTERVYKGPNAVLRLSATQVAPMIVDSDEVLTSSAAMLKPVTIDYRLGVDQLSQQS